MVVEAYVVSGYHYQCHTVKSNSPQRSAAFYLPTTRRKPYYRHQIYVTMQAEL